ncbi:DUF2623 family protein [Escherichia coli]
MYEKTGRLPAERLGSGYLTRRYGLDKEMVMDFFS